jgi:hypothetical protein
VSTARTHVNSDRVSHDEDAHEISPLVGRCSPLDHLDEGPRGLGGVRRQAQQALPVQVVSSAPRAGSQDGPGHGHEVEWLQHDAREQRVLQVGGAEQNVHLLPPAYNACQRNETCVE